MVLPAPSPAPAHQLGGRLHQRHALEQLLPRPYGTERKQRNLGPPLPTANLNMLLSFRMGTCIQLMTPPCTIKTLLSIAGHQSASVLPALICCQRSNNYGACLQTGMGPQVLSTKRSNATTGLGYGDRFNYDFVRRAREQPAPGDYALGKSCGKQTNSAKKSLPLYSFGHSTRDGAQRVYISADHEKATCGVDSPGPTTGNSVRTLPNSLTRQLSNSLTWQLSHRRLVAHPATGDSVRTLPEASWCTPCVTLMALAAISLCPMQAQRQRKQRSADGTLHD